MCAGRWPACRGIVRDTRRSLQNVEEWRTILASSPADQSTAEDRFRQAFHRLKDGCPEVLEPGSPVSQNNVAKEAGCKDPSALRKSRFPSLIREIQAYVEIQSQPSQQQAKNSDRAGRADLKTQLALVTAQRDAAQSKLISAQRRIVEMSQEVERLRNQLADMRPSPSPLR